MAHTVDGFFVETSVGGFWCFWRVTVVMAEKLTYFLARGREGEWVLADDGCFKLCLDDGSIMVVSFFHNFFLFVCISKHMI